MFTAVDRKNALLELQEHTIIRWLTDARSLALDFAHLVVPPPALWTRHCQRQVVALFAASFPSCRGPCYPPCRTRSPWDEEKGYIISAPSILEWSYTGLKITERRTRMVSCDHHPIRRVSLILAKGTHGTVRAARVRSLNPLAQP